MELGDGYYGAHCTCCTSFSGRTATLVPRKTFPELVAGILGLCIVTESKLSFKKHVEGLCTIASQKLHALSRIGNYMLFEQRRIIMNAFILAQFGYCCLVWMFHSRSLNNRINKIHCRALRIVYQDSKSSFEELLQKDNSFTIHDRNIQKLSLELYKVAYGIAPPIMRLVFPTKPSVNYPWENIFQTFNVRTVS